jgi:hypothetical protein
MGDSCLSTYKTMDFVQFPTQVYTLKIIFRYHFILNIRILHLYVFCGMYFTSVLNYRLERILTMVYVVQNYLASFGLYPSSGLWKFYKGLSERALSKRAQLSRSVLPHQPEDGDRSSLRNVVFFCKTSTYQTMDRVQKKPNSSELYL